MTEQSQTLNPHFTKRLRAYSAIAGAAVVGASPTDALGPSKSAARKEIVR